MSSRTNPGQKTGPVTDSPFATDPPPAPGRLRAFAPLAAGDIQTAKAYLDVALVRLDSMAKAGESFTPFEERACNVAIGEMLRLIAEITGRDIVLGQHPSSDGQSANSEEAAS